MSEQKKMHVLLLAVCKPEAIGGQAACARMLLRHFNDVKWDWLSFPLPTRYNSFLRFLYSIKILFQSLWICITRKIDVVHILTACGRAALFEKLIIARILKFTGVKIVINFQGAFDHYYSGFSSRDKRWIKKLLSETDVVLCLHDDIKEFLIGEKIVSPEMITVIPNAVEVEAIVPHISNPDSKIRLLYLGWLVRNKGLFTLVQAVGILRKKLREENFLLDITGPEYEEGIISSLKNEAKKYDAESFIRFHPPVFGKEKKKLFASSDVFVFPTRMEGFPFVLLEAMETGMCVVTTNISPMNLIVEHGKNGMLFQKDNADDLAEKIAETINDSLARKKMGEIARQHIIDHYSIDEIISSYRKLYNGIQLSNAML
jgi:glycosyltransferase involved in cell wall biosynthesis